MATKSEIFNRNVESWPKEYQGLFYVLVYGNPIVWLGVVSGRAMNWKITQHSLEGAYTIVSSLYKRSISSMHE